MTKKKQAKKFNYAVGFYWNGQDGSVGCYASGSEVHYGSLEEANNFLTYVNNQQKVRPKSERNEYKIFQLVEVPV